MGGLLISTLFWSRVLEVPEKNMPQLPAHKVWELTINDFSPEPEVMSLQQLIHQHLLHEKTQSLPEVQIIVPVQKPQTVLVVAPHPDDEILCCSQTIKNHLRAGDDVTIVVITNGDGKDETNPTESLTYGARRQRESLLASKKLGIPKEKILFLGFPDGHLQDIEQKGQSRSVFTQLFQTMRTSFFPETPYTWNGLQKSLQKVLEQSPPDIVYLPGQEDTHPDHDSTARAIRAAAKTKGIFPQWNEYVVHFQKKYCTAQAVDTEKLELIRIFRSQRHDSFHSEFMDQFASCEENFKTAKQ